MSKPLVNEFDRYLGARLRKLRQQQGISAAVLAEAVGSTQQQISRYENGENKLSAVQLYRTAQCLNMPVGWFFQGAEEIESTPAIRDAAADYTLPKDAEPLREELEILQRVWPQLPSARRAAILQLIDSLLER